MDVLNQLSEDVGLKLLDDQSLVGVLYRLHHEFGGCVGGGKGQKSRTFRIFQKGKGLSIYCTKSSWPVFRMYALIQNLAAFWKIHTVAEAKY